MAILSRGLLASTALTNVSVISAGLMLISSPAFALEQNTLPQNGQVIGGQATITQSSPNSLVIDQKTNNAAINWQSFSIGSNASTTFNQPNAGSIAVNRVTGVDPSQIAGRLTANGQVVLVNPNGILFSKGAQVNVGGLVASTSGISEKNAIAGNLVFDQGSNPNAKIVNDGHITARDGGLVALVAPSVANNGVITAKLGKVSLAAGDKWTLDLYGDRLVNFALNDQVTGEVKNTGVVSANGGEVQITANVAKDVVNSAIDMSGIVEANSVTQSGGTILLEADNGKVSVSGKLAANGTTGGKVQVTGATVALTGATVEASGTNGGGTVDIGGEAHGGGTLAHATTVTVDADSRLVADATKTGDAGTVAVWSDGETDFAGSISAKAATGKGGSAETSGHSVNFVGAKVDLTGATATGTWLVDPIDITIDSAAAATIATDLQTSNFTVTTGPNTVSENYAPYSTGTGNINVNANIIWNSANSLTLSALDSINVNAVIDNHGTGGIILRADNSAYGSAVAGAVNIASGKYVISGGLTSIYYHPTDYVNGVVTYSQAAGGASGGNVNGFTAYMLVDSVSDLNNVRNNLAGTYALGTNLTAVGDFNPIGSQSAAFTGIFDGNGGLGQNYTIDGASFTNGQTITQGGKSYVGLFASNSGTIRNVDITNAFLGGLNDLGALVGYNSGKLINDGATNVLVISNLGSTYVGGLVGYNALAGTMINDYATGQVTIGDGSAYAGGLVGVNYGTIGASSFVGTVIVGCEQIGGFAGGNYGTISNSTASGSVINSGGGTIGGFVGENAGLLINDAASNSTVQTAQNNTNIGGFVGQNDAGGTITNGIETGVVQVFVNSYNIGGFVGANSGVINGGSASAQVTTVDDSYNIGGFAGYNNGSISGVTATSNVMAITPFNLTADYNVGGFAGENAGTLTFDTANTYVFDTTGASHVGGLVGINDGPGTITYGSSSGTVTVGANVNFAGGLVGYNAGTINHGSAGITVLADVYSENVGGLAGGNYALVTASESFGLVSVGYGSISLGGLVGANGGYIGDSRSGMNIQNGLSAATPAGTSGLVSTGGLVGTNLTGATISGGRFFGNIQATDGLGLGGFVGANQVGATVTGGEVNGGVAAGDNIVGEGGYVGINQGVVTNGSFSGTVLAGNNAYYVAGGVGQNDAGASVSGLSVTGVVTAGNNATGIGGVIGLNGSDQNSTNSGYHGSFAAADASVSNSSFSGTVTVGSNSFAVGGLAGWNSLWTSGGSTFVGSIDPSVTGTGLVTAAANSGTTFIHNANQVGCDENGGNCFGTAGQEVITVNPNSVTTTYGQAAPALTYGLGYAVPGQTGTVSSLESGDLQSDVLQVSLQNSQTNAGQSAITGSANINPNNANALLDYTVVLSTTSTVTVNKATVTASATGSQTYGGTNATLSYSYTGLVNGDSSSVISGVTATSSVTSASNAGTYTLNVNGGMASNYNVIDVNGIYTVAKADVTASATGSQTYGGANAGLSYSYTGLVNGDSSGVISGVTATSPVTNASNAGTYTITVSGGTASNYNVTDVNGIYTVNKATLMATANGSQTYGATNPNVSYNLNGLVNGDNSSVVSGLGYTTPVTSASNVGTYAVSATGGSASNYTVVDATGALTVNPAALTIAANGSQTYGGANQSVGYTYNGLVNGDATGVVSGLSYTTPVTASSNAGTYGITAVGGMASNYTITDASGIYTVGKANVTASATGSQTYGGANAGLSYSYTGLVNGDSSGVISGVTATSPVTSASNAGTYTITVNGGTASNYNVTDVNGVYTVNKATLTATANGSQTYGAVNPNVSYNLNGLVNGDNSSVVSGLGYTTPVTSASNVGTYAVAATGGSASNYTVVDAAGTLIVNPAALTIATNGSQTYGGANQTVGYTYNGLVNGDATGVVSGLSYTTPVTASSNAGTYGITAVGGMASNYTITDASGTYTVGKAALTATANGSQTYGATNPSVSYNLNGLVNGDNSSVVSGLGYTTPVTSASNVGTYSVSATGGSASNYTVVDATGTLTVNPAALTIAANGSQTYGGANQTVGYTYNGLVNGDATGVVSGLSYSTPATASSNAGTYGITAVGGTAGNYTITDASGTYTVNKAALTATANGSQTYGDANPSVSYNLSGLVNGDNNGVVTGLGYTTPVNSSSNAGTYAVTATGGSAINYTITDGTGTLTVNKANLTATANGSQTYGAANPSVSYNLSGLVNGDSSGVVSGLSYTTPATSASNVGTYAITEAGGSASNYNVVGATGTLMVNQAALTITANGSQLYGGSNAAVSYAYNGLVNGDATGVVSGLSYTTPVTSSSTVGTYTVTAVGGSASNYAITDATGSYSVNKAAITITPTGSQTYGGSNVAVSYSYTGLVNGDSSSIVSGASYTTSATSSSNVGTYAVTALGGSAANYSIVDASGTFAVTPAALTIAANGSQTYGGGNQTVGYTYNGLVNGDATGVVSGLSYSTPATASSNAGTYTIAATGGTAGNYTITDASGTYTVNKAGLTVTPTGSQTYGSGNQTVNYGYTGLVNGDNSGVVTGVSYTTPANSTSNAGSYTVTAQGGSASNYTITDGSGTLTVNPAALTVTPNGAQIYGGSNVSVGYIYTGLVNGDTSGVVTGIGYTTPVTSSSNAGVYTVTATGGSAGNYTVTDGSGTYIVGKATVTVTPTASQTYGGANQTVAYGYSGLVNGDSSGVVTGIGYTTPVTASSNAGTYAITTTGGTASNYNVADATGVDTVNKAPLTLSATGSQTYGGSNLSVSYGYAGLVNGDNSNAISGLGYTTTATPSSNVGTYTIAASGGSSANYSLTDGPAAAFTINPASLTVAANNVTRNQGTNTPAFTASFVGLVNGDASSVVTGLTFAPGNTSGLADGTYTNLITVSGGTAQNYLLTYQAGTLTVSTPATAPVTPVTPVTTTPGTTGTTATTVALPGQVETVVGQIAGLNSLLQTFNTTFANTSNQATCLKVNSEVRGVTTDSPIDCAAPLQVNGF